MSDDGKVAALIKERQYIRQRITRIYNHALSIDASELSQQKISIYIEKLLALKAEMSVVDKNCFSYVMTEDADVEFEIAVSEEYEEKIQEALTALHELVSMNSVGAEVPYSPTLVTSKLRLPEISLPEFSNAEGESLEFFLHSFESIVDKHRLSTYEKFVYLRGQLTKAPRALIDSLASDEQSYTNAKELLVEAFASPLTQKYDVIGRLVKLKLALGDDPYSFIGEMRSILSSFESLEIDVEVILQYFIWNGLNDNFQSQFIHITNHVKPNLQEIKTCAFEAAERYLKLTDGRVDHKYGEKPKQANVGGNSKIVKNNTSSFAVNVNKKPSVACHLCISDGKNVKHAMKDCNNYPLPVDKVRKLNELNFCAKCSFKNHNTNQCKFKFSSKCYYCKGEHMSFLCTSAKGPAVAKNILNTNVRMSYVYTHNSKFEDDILLGTLSSKIEYGGRSVTVRALRDSGSQRNFILKSVAEELQLPVIEENVELVVHGFNSSKTLKTKTVRVPLILNNKNVEIEAVVKPSIDIEINVPDVNSVVSGFTSKGYNLADEFLLHSNGKIGQFGLIVGANCEAILRSEVVTFGQQSECAFINSTAGVMLTGSVKTLINNLDYLPCVSGCDSVCVNSSSYSATAFQVIDEKGELVLSELSGATEEALKTNADSFLNFDEYDDGDITEVNDTIIDYVLDNSERAEDGRIIMPLPWNSEIKHLLGSNFDLARKILVSNLKKLRNSNNLVIYDEVFKEQENLGIIERIENVDSFMHENDNFSVMPHMGVFKPNRETTKCRVVFLSNLCEKTNANPNAVNHNQALHPGPNLNQKLSTAIILSRFDKFVLTFDIKKAFLCIGLREEDQNKLLFLWFRDVNAGDFRLIFYRCKRLPFGLRPSPFILMISLYRMLVLDVENDDSETREMKGVLYNLMYMDNGCYSCNDKCTLSEVYERLPDIFGSYQFHLQQFTTNDLDLQRRIDKDQDSETDQTVKFFGMNWCRESDKFSPSPIELNKNASTKREILSSLNSVYDLFNIYAPMLNRAKLFFQKLQTIKSLTWDTKVSDELQKEWTLICNQANKTPVIEIDRFVGSKTDLYDLVAFSDASAVLYGAVLYLRNINTGQISFLYAKNKVVAPNSSKSIPTLECQGIAYASDQIIETYSELTRKSEFMHINIRDLYVFTDSLVCVYWLQSYFLKYDKMQKRSIFVLNRIKQISENCKVHPITFSYIEGAENPADAVSRPLSYKTVMKTNFYSGPGFLKTDYGPLSEISVVVPNPVSKSVDQKDVNGVQNSSLTLSAAVKNVRPPEHLLDLTKYSSFSKMAGVMRYVLKFVSVLKNKVSIKKNLCNENSSENHYRSATEMLISIEQRIMFPDIFQYFDKRPKTLNKIPNLVLQLNVYLDGNILRVKGKFAANYNPILLSYNSIITTLIVKDVHESLSHAGIYVVLKHVRKSFWIVRGFTTVRRILSSCVTCRKVNARPIKLNQNSYRSTRVSPPMIPYAYVYIDFMGPWNVKFDNVSKKLWVLVITCMWTRAINLKIAFSMDVNEFLRVLQMHIYEYGLFQLCVSDLGSQITAGSKIITNFLDEPETCSYLSKQGVGKVKFEQFSKGNSSLGGLVENCVKQTKRLITKTIHNRTVSYLDFQLLISKVTHVINRRPISFKESLRDCISKDEIPEAITPENLTRGYELISLNIIPQIQPSPVDDSYIPRDDPVHNIRQEYFKLRKANEDLMNSYHSEFLVNLMTQAIDRRDRYKPVKTTVLHVGDIVLLVEKFTKQSCYPMGIIERVEINSLGEVTAAIVWKGKTKERVYRHATSLILLLARENLIEEEREKISENEDTLHKEEKLHIGRTLPLRKSAAKSRQLLGSLIKENLV